MKYMPLMPFLIAAVFYIPHAHAAGQPEQHVSRTPRTVAALSRPPTAPALPAASGYALLLTALGVSLLAVRRPQSETVTDLA